MLRHCSLFKFRGGTADSVIDEIVARFRMVAGGVPAIRDAAIGRNAGFHGDNYDIAANIDFDSLDGYREYCVDETHLAFVNEWLLPYLESRVAVQFLLTQNEKQVGI